MLPVASALVPGSGQLLARKDRGAVYLLVEAFLLTEFISSARRAGREDDRFHSLAFDVARASFSPLVSDTAFEYFEQMEKFVASGPFDADPLPGLQPPVDERTFNGSIWALARRTFLPDPAGADPASPEYQRALDFYRNRAVGANFQWSWLGAELEQDAFRQAIDRRNNAWKRRSNALGFLLANHLVSALDAFVFARLAREGAGPSLTMRLHSRAPGQAEEWFAWSIGVFF